MGDNEELWALAPIPIELTTTNLGLSLYSEYTSHRA